MESTIPNKIELIRVNARTNTDEALMSLVDALRKQGFVITDDIGLEQETEKKGGDDDC